MKMTMIENEHLNCVQMISCKLTIENDDNRTLWGVTVLHGCMVNWQERCNSVAWIYGQLAGGQSVIDPCYTVTPHKSICQQYRCAFSYMLKLICCNGLPCTCGHLRGPSSISIYVHSPICQTDLV